MSATELEEGDGLPRVGGAGAARLTESQGLLGRRAMRDGLSRVDPGLAVAVGLALLALAPLLLRRGYVLSWDMVFVPDPPLVGRLLGLDGDVARGVPADAIVALAAQVIPADFVQKLVLLGVFIAGAWGAARLAPVSPAGRAAAASFFVWNAYVYERLVLGHWSLLVSYAALPWAVRAAIDMRLRVTGARRRLVAALAVASFGSASGGLIVAGTALLVVAVPVAGALTHSPHHREDRLGARATDVAVVVGAALVLALPWLVPSVLRPEGLPASSEGVNAFAARADTPLGVLGSLLTLGGIWHPDVVPPGRGALATLPALLLLTGAAFAGWQCLARRWDPGAALGLTLAALAGLVTAAAGATPVLREGVQALVEAFPGAGLLRDGQRYLAPLGLAQAMGFAVAVDWLLARFPQAGRGLTVVAAALVPVLSLPVLAFAAGGRLAPVDYPDDFAVSRVVVDGDPRSGGVLILPWTQYIAPEWNRGRPVFDPAQRWFSRPMLGSADLVVRGVRIEAEQERVRAAGRLAGGDAPLNQPALATLGVRYVLLTKLQGWEEQADRLEGLQLVHEGAALRLYRAEDSSDGPSFTPGRRIPVIAGTALAAGLALWAFVPASLLRRVTHWYTPLAPGGSRGGEGM